MVKQIRPNRSPDKRITDYSLPFPLPLPFSSLLSHPHISTRITGYVFSLKKKFLEIVYLVMAKTKVPSMPVYSWPIVYADRPTKNQH